MLLSLLDRFDKVISLPVTWLITRKQSRLHVWRGWLHFALPAAVFDCFPSLSEMVDTTQKRSEKLQFKLYIPLYSCSAFTVEAFVTFTSTHLTVISSYKYNQKLRVAFISILWGKI